MLVFMIMISTLSTNQLYVNHMAIFSPYLVKEVNIFQYWIAIKMKSIKLDVATVNSDLPN